MIKKIITKRKAGRQYTPFDVNDVYGGRIVVPSDAAKIHALNRLQEISKQPNAPFQILNVQNMKKSTYSAVHVDIKTPSGTRGEIQIVTPWERAEAVVNHPIRALLGESPPPKAEKVKVSNAKIISKLSSPAAMKLGQDVENLHKQNVDTAAMLPLDLKKGLPVANPS